LIGGEEGASAVINGLSPSFSDFLLCLFEFLLTYKPLALYWLILSISFEMSTFLGEIPFRLFLLTIAELIL
jgi:hypothetical protein